MNGSWLASSNAMRSVRRCWLLLLLCLSVMPVLADSGHWPQSFVRTAGEEHTVVVLYDDGSAAYSTRKKRPGTSDWVFAATRANGQWCDDAAHRAKGARRCLMLFVSGFDGDQPVRVTLLYWYEITRMTEFDEQGDSEVLTRTSAYGTSDRN